MAGVRVTKKTVSTGGGGKKKVKKKASGKPMSKMKASMAKKKLKDKSRGDGVGHRR